MSNSLSLAQAFAYSLATSLMACVTLFQSEGGYGAMPTTEFDGEPDSVLHIYDPWEDCWPQRGGDKPPVEAV